MYFLSEMEKCRTRLNLIHLEWTGWRKLGDKHQNGVRTSKASWFWDNSQRGLSDVIGKGKYFSSMSKLLYLSIIYINSSK